MFYTSIALLLSAALATTPCGGKPAPSPLNGGVSCNTGPVTKTFGGSTWLVYACRDGRGIAVVSAPHNPAFPYIFLFYPTDKGMQLHGEGTGDKRATDAAFKVLAELSSADIAALFQQAKAHACTNPASNST
jgi:hypothetical protein